MPDITVGYTGNRLIAAKGEDSINLPDKMAFLVGVGPQRIEAAFSDALKGKYTFNAEELQMIRRWLR